MHVCESTIYVHIKATSEKTNGPIKGGMLLHSIPRLSYMEKLLHVVKRTQMLGQSIDVLVFALPVWIHRWLCAWSIITRWLFFFPQDPRLI